MGSSSTSTGRSASRARASTRRWCWPPESASAHLADPRVEPLGQGAHPVVDPRAAERLQQIGVGRRRARDAEVLADRRVEEMRLLAREGEGAANVLLTVLAGIPPCDRDDPVLGVEEPEQEVGNGRLAGTARPDQRHSAPRVEAKVEALEHGEALACRVARRDALERDDRCGWRCGEGRHRVTNGGLAVGQLEHAPPGRQRRRIARVRRPAEASLPRTTREPATPALPREPDRGCPSRAP